MNSIISFILLITSGRLCLSAVLVTIDELDRMNLRELLRIPHGYEQQYAMYEYDENEKTLICQEIIASPIFSDYYKLEMVDKTNFYVLQLYRSQYAGFYPDHFLKRYHERYQRYRITEKKIKFGENENESVALKTFGCLTVPHDKRTLVEVFVSYGFAEYTFTISFRSVTADPQRGSEELVYVGIAEFFVSLSEALVASNSRSLSRILHSDRDPVMKEVEEKFLNEYGNSQYLPFATELLMSMPKCRSDRVCKTVYKTFHPEVTLGSVQSEDKVMRELELSNEEKIEIAVLSCSNSAVNFMYVAPSKQTPSGAYVFRLKNIHNPDKLELVLLDYFIPTIPALNWKYTPDLFDM